MRLAQPLKQETPEIGKLAVYLRESFEKALHLVVKQIGLDQLLELIVNYYFNGLRDKITLLTSGPTQARLEPESRRAKIPIRRLGSYGLARVWIYRSRSASGRMRTR